MKNIVLAACLLGLSGFMVSCGHEPPKDTTVVESTRTSLTYHDLALKDLDQMVHFVSRKIDESRKDTENKVHPLKVALRAVYSRPDDDAMIEKVVGPLRSEVDEVDNWEHVISDMVKESIAAMQDPQGTPAEQFTQVVFLQNIIAQNRPAAKDPGFSRNIIAEIRDAHLKLSRAAKNEGELRLMKSVYSPSETAEKTLGKETKAEKAAREKRAKEEKEKSAK